MRLRDKTALITRCGNEIGQAIAVRCAKEGAFIIACDSSMATSERVRELVKKEKGKAVAWELDPYNSKVVTERIAAAADKYGGIDILVNHVDYFQAGEFVNMSTDAWEMMIQKHFNAYFNITRAVVEGMLTVKCGRIVNVLTNANPALLQQKDQIHYQTVCSGIEGFTRALAEETGKFRVTVNSVIAENIDTEQLRKRALAEGLYRDDLKNLASALVPLERLGKATEVADTILFLASNESAYISGQIFHVKGGP